MKKHLLLAAMLLTATASVGTFTACSNDDPAPRVQPNPQEGTTMMSIQFSLQMPKQKRAADDKQNLSNPEFNYAGKWIGNDLIKGVDVYIFKADPAAAGGYSLETSDNLDATKIDFQQPMAGNNDVAYIRPKKGFKVNPGQKKVFVVVNPTTETQALLTGATDLTAFETKYNGVLALQTAAGNPAPTKYTEAEATTAAGTTDPFTVADHLAKVEGTAANQKDVIVMTGLAGEINVQDNVNEVQTLNTSSPVNRAKVTVQRTVARVLVTSDATSYDVKGDDPTTPAVESEADGNAVVLATIDNLTYVVAQGESSLYFNQQDSDNPTNYQYKTPNSTYIPTGTADDPASDYDATVYQKYDYTGLWRKHDNKLGGYDVPTNAAYDASLNNVVGQVQNQDGLHGEFFLPNTHAYHDTDRGQSGYRKGNTAYVLIRGKINPKFVYTGANQVDNNWTATHADDDLFLGDDGKFYASAALANDPTTNGNAAAAAMKVKKFVKGKVLYFVWVNPDHTSGKEWINSPAIRNNIYHIQISGIANYVYNWNPLIPNPNDPVDPTKPVSPENPRDPNNPNNPDPQPSVPDPNHPGKNIPDPKEPPTDITPKDPLSLKEAWMSVDVTILPWQVHTAKVILGN
jgi:Pg-II fimbriae c